MTRPGDPEFDARVDVLMKASLRESVAKMMEGRPEEEIDAETDYLFNKARELGRELNEQHRKEGRA